MALCLWAYSPHESRSWMHWFIRLGLFAFGLLMILVGRTELHMGLFVFPNLTYRQTTFASAGIALGAVFCLLALLPRSDWVYKHITTGHKIRRHRKYRLDR